MTTVRSAYGGDAGSMPGSSKPVVNGGANSAALDRRFTGTVMAGDQQQYSITPSNGLFKASIDRCPGRIQVHPMKIEHPIRFDRAASESLVPATVERARADRCGFRTNGFGDSRRNEPSHGLARRRLGRLSRLGGRKVARKRLDRGSDAPPQLRFVRAERAHESRRLWAAG